MGGWKMRLQHSALSLFRLLLAGSAILASLGETRMDLREQVREHSTNSMQLLESPEDHLSSIVGNGWAEWGARRGNPPRSTSLSGDGASGTGTKPRGCMVLLIFQRLVAQTDGKFASELRTNTLGSPRTEVSLGMRKTRPMPYLSREQDRSLCTLI